MPSGLKRELGLFSTSAIAIGAMVGSGIFILPGVAYMQVEGPAVVAAFLIAGLLVLPAALSASEMATAMPEDGGSYVYVERGMGPLLGTIAGIGNWFMLSFKGALALVGGVPYLIFVAPGVAEYIIPIAIGLALLFTIINIVSTKSAGGFQFAIVGIMILVMGWFVVSGAPDIVPERTAGAFSVGSGGFLAATALVFISYAGVIKIAAVAEEVKDPGKTIPRAMIGSLVFTTLLYVLIVYVAIGLVDIPAAIEAGELNVDGEGPIMALAADATLGPVGVAAVVLAALLALASTANAGLLSASRFPFAMARDNLAPSQFETVSDRFNTPVLSVAVSGGIIILLVAFFPIDQVAKFGSAFQIIVFMLVNLALIGFREGTVEGYDPEFVAPLYPWVQLFGMASGLVVLTQVGTVPLLGAVGVTSVAVIYYVLYASKRVDREGAARGAIRQNIGEAATDRTRSLFEDDGEYDVLVALTDQTSDQTKRGMLRVATDMGRLRTTDVSVVEFLDIPHQIFAEQHATVIEKDEPKWLQTADGSLPKWYPDRQVNQETDGGQTAPLSERNGERQSANTKIRYREIDSEDHKDAIVDFATYEGIDLLLIERRTADFYDQLFGGETQWILDNAPCDVVLVEDRGFTGADEIAVVANRGAFDPLKILLADAIAEETGAELNLLHALPADAPESQRETIKAYHNELISLCTVPARSTVIETDDRIKGLTRFVGEADLLVTGVDRSGISGQLFGRPANRLVDSVSCTSLMVQTHDGAKRRGILRRLLMDYLFS